MKVIYMQNNGVAAVMVPSECSRLALSVTLLNGETIRSVSGAQPVDTFLSRWPVDGAVAEWAETELQWISRAAARSIPAGIPFEIVPDSSIPTDRTFRDAWRLDGVNGVQVDMPAAREIYRTRLREIRAPLLAALDIAFMRTLETGDTAERLSIIAKKEALRAVTEDPAIDAAETPEQLKAVIPAALQ
jgi:hypothetical protein